MPKNAQFVNFEQMQQQLENEMTLGGGDLSHNQHNNFMGGFANFDDNFSKMDQMQLT